MDYKITAAGGILAKKKDEKTFSLEHFLIPVHELLSGEQKKEVLLKFNITEEQLPKIKKNDPGLKLFNIKAKQGDVIRIKRKDPTGSYDYYRTVI